jgi:hypothetical protein
MLADIVKNRTFVFEKIHYLHIFFYLMFKRYDKLADNIVNINGVFSDKTDAISLLKNRTKKFDLGKFGEDEASMNRSFSKVLAFNKTVQ